MLSFIVDYSVTSPEPRTANHIELLHESFAAHSWTPSHAAHGHVLGFATLDALVWSKAVTPLSLGLMVGVCLHRNTVQ